MQGASADRKVRGFIYLTASSPRRIHLTVPCPFIIGEDELSREDWWDWPPGSPKSSHLKGTCKGKGGAAALCPESGKCSSCSRSVVLPRSSVCTFSAVLSVTRCWLFVYRFSVLCWVGVKTRTAGVHVQFETKAEGWLRTEMQANILKNIGGYAPDMLWQIWSTLKSGLHCVEPRWP